MCIRDSLSTVIDGTMLIKCVNFSPSAITIDKNTVVSYANPLSLRSSYSVINKIESSQGLSDDQLRDVYKEILLSKSKKESDLLVLQDSAQLEQILDFLLAHKEVIALGDDKVECCPLGEFKIEIVPDSPKYFYTPSYNLPHKFQADISNWIDDSIIKGYIEPSDSPHSSPLLVIPKKDSAKPKIVLDYSCL